MKEWFGFRVVRASGIGHGFVNAGGSSLCGRVVFGPEVRTHKPYRPCAICGYIWRVHYPPGRQTVPA